MRRLLSSSRVGGCWFSTHVDHTTQRPGMVDVSKKPPTARTAVAIAFVRFPECVSDAIVRSWESDAEMKRRPPTSASGLSTTTKRRGTNSLKLLAMRDWESKKGPVLATAIVAGTLAVKSTSVIIPFCHPLPIDACKITADFALQRRKPRRLCAAKRRGGRSWSERWKVPGVRISCEVGVTHRTGVEMEALTGAAVAALTVYDMVKGVPGAQQGGMGIERVSLLRKTGGKSDVVRRVSSRCR